MYRLLLVLILFSVGCSDEPPSPLPEDPASIDTVTATPEQAALWAGRYTFEDVGNAEAWNHALDLDPSDPATVLTGTYTVDGPQTMTRAVVRGDVMGDSVSVVLTEYAPDNALETAAPGSVLFVLVRTPERPALLETRWKALRPSGRGVVEGGAAFRRSAELVVEAGGLRVVNPITGSARPLPFGMTQSSLMQALASIKGDPIDQVVNEECGAGPLTLTTWSDGLVLLFQDGYFAGWYSSENARIRGHAPTTAAGIGANSKWLEVQSVYDAELQQTTLGTEFIVGDDLFGLLDGEPADSARVELLWSGVSCFFR